MAVEGFILRSIVVLSILAFSFVVRNQQDGQQWAIWWWVCIVGLVIFIPTIFTVSGYWRTTRARTAIYQQEQEQNMGIEAS